MTGEGAGEFIRLEGEGGSVAVRITGRAEGAALAGEIVVDTEFVRGRAATSLAKEDLAEWQEALDALDTGEDAGWREGRRAPGLVVERDAAGGRAHVTVAGGTGAPVTVTLAVTLTDAWFDDAYHRLDEARHTWS